MITWKLFWSVGGSVITLVLTVILVFTGAPLLVAIPVLVAAGVVFASTASRVIHGSDLFVQVRIEDKQTVIRLIATAVCGHAVWALAFLVNGSLMWILVLGGFVVVEYAVARGHEYMLTTTPRKGLVPRPPDTTSSAQPNVGDQVMDAGRAAFLRSGHEWLTILSWDPIDTGDQVIGIVYAVRIPSKHTAKNAGKKLSGEDIEPMAIAFSEVLDTPLASDWVHIKKEPAAGVYTVTILVVDALATVHEYVDVLEPASIKDPALIARTLGGMPYRHSLNEHWSDVGQTRSGKSSLIHVKWAYITRCQDAVLWVGGVEKLFDAVGPWIEPYLTTDLPLPFDWVAFGAQDTANLLAAAISIGRWRQSVPHQQRGGFKTIIVQLDEASFFLVLNRVRATCRDGTMNPTQLAEAISKGMGSADIWIHLASQRGTNNNWGDCGGDISANIIAQTVFATSDEAEVGRATGDWKLPIPQHRGEFLLKPGDGRPVERLKAEYIQETDPTKPRLHEGATLSDVAWARRHFHSELDPGSARAGGEFYANRLTRADDVYRYLTNTVAALLPEHGSAYSETYGDTAAELDFLLADAGIVIEERAAPTEAAPKSAPVEPSAGPRISRIEAIIQRSGPIGNRDIRAALAAEGDSNAGDQTITNALSRLVSEGRVKRAERGLYTPA